MEYIAYPMKEVFVAADWLQYVCHGYAEASMHYLQLLSPDMLPLKIG